MRITSHYKITRNPDLYDSYEKSEQLGFTVKGREIEFNLSLQELYHAWDNLPTEKKGWFEYPPIKYVEPIEYVAIEELILGYNIIYPWGSDLDILSMKFINKLTELGFKDFICTPVLVYLVEGREQVTMSIHDLRKNYQPRDDLFGVLQFTNPPLGSTGQIVEENPDFEFPLVFVSKIPSSGATLRCNALAKEAFSTPEFSGLLFF
jgi:hypothetical protein